jgi:hypothetical protein
MYALGLDRKMQGSTERIAIAPLVVAPRDFIGNYIDDSLKSS